MVVLEDTDFFVFKEDSYPIHEIKASLNLGYEKDDFFDVDEFLT